MYGIHEINTIKVTEIEKQWFLLNNFKMRKKNKAIPNAVVAPIKIKYRNKLGKW